MPRLRRAGQLTCLGDGAGWTDVQLDGIRCIRQYPRLRQGEHVKLIVVDDVVDESGLATSRTDVEHTERYGVPWRRAGAGCRSRVEFNAE